jgi:CelD/BcsL family acetyltransferase involved in cellulose biosynthesis
MDELRLIETADELDELAPAWEALAGRAGSPMQRHAWASAFAEAYGTEYELKVLASAVDGEVDAIAPLAIRRTGIDRLELMGGEELSEPGDLVYRDRDSLARLAAGMADLAMPMLLGRVVAESPTVEALRGAFGRRTIFYGREAASYPWIPLDETWREPEQKFNSDRRSDLRRARRRAEKDGEVTSEVIAPGRDELPALLDEVFRVEAAGWKGREGTALAADDRLRRFFAALARKAADAGILRLAFLRIGARTAAVQLAAQCGDCFWLLKVGYDEEFKRSSPGTLLMLETVRHAAEEGLASYELLGTVESWTRVWTDRERECLALRAYPPRPGGIAAAALDVGRFARRGSGTAGR